MKNGPTPGGAAAGPFAAAAIILGATIIGMGSGQPGFAAPPAAATSRSAVTPASAKTQLANLKRELTAAPTSAPARGAPRGGDERTKLLETITKIGESIDQADYESAQDSIQRALRLTQSASYQKSLLALSDSITALQAIAMSTYMDQVHSLLKGIPDRMKEAKTERDLEATNREILAVFDRFDRRGIPGDVRQALEGPMQQLRNELDVLQRYQQMLAHEASGEVGAAHEIGKQLLDRFATSDRSLPGREAVRERLDAMDQRQADSDRQRLTELARNVHDAKSFEALLSIQDRFQALIETAQRQSAGRDVTGRYNFELQTFQIWMRAIEFKSKHRFRSALAAISELRHRTNVLQPFTSIIITSDMIENEAVELQRQILERGDEIADPMLKLLADALGNANSVQDLQKTALAIDSSAGSWGSGSGPDMDSQWVIIELTAAANHVHALAKMQNALKTLDWRTFWQTNAAITVAGRSEPYGNPRPSGRFTAMLNARRMILIRDAAAQSGELRDLKLALDDKTPLDRTVLDAADAAIAAKDYRRAASALKAYFLFAYGENGQGGDPATAPASLLSDLRGLDLYAQAVSFEAAGDLASAVARYRAIIQLTGPRVPLSEATERLGAIAKKHPELLRGRPEDPATTPADRPILP